MTESASLSFSAPAKLNLFLHITGRRGDGYHELQTVFQFIDLCDVLDFSLRTDGEIVRTNNIPGLCAEQDLIVRAARLLQAYTASTQGANITIHKNIPLGAGLGGGSSNAATVLLALNQLWGCACSVDNLATLGLRLGADVPVFIHGMAAWAEGIGEHLTPVNPPEDWFLVLAPKINVSTAQVFNHSQLTRNSHPITIRTLDEAIAWENCHNDCEAVVKKQYPLIAAALDWLQEYTQARLTGTGACLFGRFAMQQQAIDVQKKIFSDNRFKTVQSYVVRGLNQSPVHSELSIM